jgi:catechol 2,3-dioxygenase-like lactoylglutathione lyase family enzyme
MLKDVPLTGIFVDDQEAALDFYTGKLGLEKVQDEPYGEGARWITVSPAEMRIRIVLKKAEKEHEKAMVGNSDGAASLTATRGESGRCSWTRTAAPSSCCRSRASGSNRRIAKGRGTGKGALRE